MAALTYTSRQKTCGVTISQEDIDRHHQELSKCIQKALSPFDNQRGREVYTDMNSCIAEIRSYPNGEANILELKIYGREEKVRPLVELLSSEKARWFYVRGEFSKFRSGKQTSPEELIRQTYWEENNHSKWHDGIIRELLEDLSGR